MLDSLRGIEVAKTKPQSVIEFKRGREDLSEDLMRQALKEPEVKPSINRNLAGMLVKQGRMREALPFAKVAYDAEKRP